MQNLFQYSDNNKRYHTLSYHNRSRGVKRVKAVLNAGLTCPNRDGSRGKGGCLYCCRGGSYFSGCGSLTEQLMAERERIHRKMPEASLVAYFQAGTNTYAPVSKLQQFWEEALACPDVDAMAIATRADCLPDDVCDALAQLSNRIELTVELGLQTAWDSTAEIIGRGHTWDEFKSGYFKLKEWGIRCCVHLINGLPGETQQDMLGTARLLANLRPDAVKIHSLHVMENTELADWWRAGRYIPISREDYVSAVVGQLELLPPETVIERITGDADRSQLLAPLWSADKKKVLAAIDRRLVERNTWQGRLYRPESVQNKDSNV